MAVSNVSTINADNWQLITTNAITSGNTSSTFSSISGYKKLMIVGKDVHTGTADYLCMQFNSDTANNYGSVAINGTATQSQFTKFIYTASTSNYFNGYAIIEDVDTSAPKRVTGYISNSFSGGMWYSTSALTSILIFLNNGNSWDTGTFYLYGIAS